MEKKPNIVLIISDQWSTRISDGSGQYSTGIQTPHIDRLAAEGMRFTQSYSSFPLCCPARSTMFTGLMPHNHNFIDNEETFYHKHGEMPVRTDITTMGAAFKQAGYKTAYFGKEHAAGYGWDGIDEFGTYKNTGGGWLGDGANYDPIFTRDAIDYLHQDHEQPFYMVLSLINPHDICVAFGGRLDGISITDALSFARPENSKHLQGNNGSYLRGQPIPSLPTNFDAQAIMGMINPADHSYKALENWTEHDWYRYIATFCLLTENTDWLIGLFLSELRKQGLEEDTIVVFTTDHGEMLGSHRLISKVPFYEESAKTMMIVKYPGQIAPGMVNDTALINTTDLMPTMLDLCDVPLPMGMDGHSFKALCIQPEMAEGFDELFAVNTKGRMLRSGPYKYVRSEIDGKQYDILFDLTADPDETTNVFNATGYEAISVELTQRMTAWLTKENLKVAFDPV